MNLEIPELEHVSERRERERECTVKIVGKAQGWQNLERETESGHPEIFGVEDTMKRTKGPLCVHDSDAPFARLAFFFFSPFFPFLCSDECWKSLYMYT